MISRREARKSALTLLYQWDVTERAPGELYEGEIDDYAQAVTSAVVRDVAELDRRITAAAEESGWTADRLGAVERNILRIAIHELDEGEAEEVLVERDRLLDVPADQREVVHAARRRRRNRGGRPVSPTPRPRRSAPARRRGA